MKCVIFDELGGEAVLAEIPIFVVITANISSDEMRNAIVDNEIDKPQWKRRC